MRDREEEFVLYKGGIELAGQTAGGDYCRASGRVDRYAAKAREID